MSRQHSTATVALAALLLLPTQAASAGATTIYKSVDEKGRVSFSDQPPVRNELVDVIEYATPTRNSSALDQERIDAMREVTDRMAADRREREASRARARSEALARANSQATPYYGVQDTYYPAYLPRRHRPGRPGAGHPGYGHPGAGHPGYGHPGYRPPTVRPPIHRPPLQRPPMQRPEQLTASFNNYPASLIRRHYTGVARREFYKQPYFVR